MPGNFHSIGKGLVALGLAIAAAGALILLGGKISWFGRLPGDIRVERPNFTFYFPIATSIVVSVVLSLLVLLLRRK